MRLNRWLDGPTPSSGWSGTTSPTPSALVVLVANYAALLRGKYAVKRRCTGRVRVTPGMEER
ncbi:hypothetical protein [Streptomyces sp. NBC_00162]|uniref:hypothetical protein n=1 Tax=Streptomyces sp. NBC_00162 TaxID=2903629 RepID=UPI00214B6434|nr:hypothetical protein [Streptomyces sp. NBC_00162]UUU44369.1 hypothetical protein JIW86_39940 [Streptomyces sp. NBC_00162]